MFWAVVNTRVKIARWSANTRKCTSICLLPIVIDLSIMRIDFWLHQSCITFARTQYKSNGESPSAYLTPVLKFPPIWLSILRLLIHVLLFQAFWNLKLVFSFFFPFIRTDMQRTRTMEFFHSVAYFVLRPTLRYLFLSHLQKPLFYEINITIHTQWKIYL